MIEWYGNDGRLMRVPAFIAMENNAAALAICEKRQAMRDYIAGRR